MSESLRNDGRVWVPKQKGDARRPEQIPEADRDYYLERKYPSFGNLVPRDVASRNAKQVCDEGRGVGDSHLAVSSEWNVRLRLFSRKSAIDHARDSFAARRSVADTWSAECRSCSFQGWHHALTDRATVRDFPIECTKSASFA